MTFAILVATSVPMRPDFRRVADVVVGGATDRAGYESM
jgi:hypothetical protein